MAVTSVKLIGDGQGASDEGISNTRATRVWRVQVDDPLDSELTVLTAPGLPVRYEPHPENGYLTARRKSPTRLNKRAWIVTVEYSTEPVDTEEVDREAQPNPRLRRAKIMWRKVQRQVVSSQDFNGKPFLNSAAEEFDAESRLVDVDELVVSVSKNVADLPTWILNFEDATNNGVFSVRGVDFPAGTLRLENLQIGDETSENGITFLSVAFELHYRREGWIRRILDRGYRVRAAYDSGANGVLSGTTFTASGENFNASGVAVGDLLVDKTNFRCTTIASIDSATQLTLDATLGDGTDLDYATRSIDKFINIENSDGTRPTEPELLDGCGGRLTNPTSDRARYLEFTVQNSVSFSALNSLLV